VQPLRSTGTRLQLEDVSFDDAGTTLPCDVSTGRPRPIIPTGWLQLVSNAIHGLARPAKKASQWLVAAKFVWHWLKKDVRDWAEVCVVCQQGKMHHHVKAPLAYFPVPERRFNHIHVDLVGRATPLPGLHLPPHNG